MEERQIQYDNGEWSREYEIIDESLKPKQEGKGEEKLPDGYDSIKQLNDDFVHNLNRALEIAAERDKALQEIERLKGILWYQYKSWFITFYQATSKMTAREIHDFYTEEWNKFKSENNL